MSILGNGMQVRLLQESPVSAGVSEKQIAIQTDTVLLTLFASEIENTLAVTAYAVAEAGQETELFSFPVLSAGTSELLLKRAAISTSNVVVRALYSGGCKYTVHARGVQGGISDTKLRGAEILVTSQVIVGTTATLLVPASMEDRVSIAVKNWSSDTDVFIGESEDNMLYPLAGRDSITIGLSAGQELWGYASANSADVRIAEIGG